MKSKLFSFLILFLLVFAAIAVIPVNAHTPPWTVSTYSYIVVEPSPIGVGQTAYVTYWIDKVPPTASGSWGYRWHGMTITVTKPDGTTENLGPFNSDAVGGAWASYVPQMVGTYTFVGHFPSQVVVNENPYPFPLSVDIGVAFVNDTYAASDSTPVTLTVTNQQLTSNYPDNPLPKDYWSRPISSMNRNWYTLGGNWLGLASTNFGITGKYDANNGNFNPYTTAPESAHVLWTKSLAFGGQIGGEFGDSQTSVYATGTAYEAKFSAVIISGILYYTEYPGAGNNPGKLKAVDLRTGQEVWNIDAKSPLKCGMVYNFVNGDQYGALSYLFTAPATMGFIPYPPGNTWSMYDAKTGAWILDIANTTAGTLVRGPNGELLSYRASGGMLSLWNASRLMAKSSDKLLTFTYYSGTEIWRPPQGANISWTDGNQWSAPLATNLSGVPISLSVSKVSDDVVLATQSAPAVPGGHNMGWRVDAAYSAIDGRLLWGPVNRTLTPWTGVGLGPAAEGVYTEYTRQTMTMSGYDLKTGQKLYNTLPFNSSWNYYNYNIGAIAYGNLYVWGLSGEVYCFDVHTGTLKWNWNAGSAGIDTPYGTWPLGTWPSHYVIADGKLYLRAGHDYTPPVFKGAKIYCLNAYTGEKLWDSLSFDIVSSPAVADGIMLWDNGYDNLIYAYGKGLSATTVSVPDTAIPLGSPVLIKGTVTDQSPGKTCIGVPAAGTPAISDADMSRWMEYLYQQQPKPTNATGVSIHLTAIDPNGNSQEIGTITSDIKGNYFASWTPTLTGIYKISASFEGSKSYYSSDVETAFLIGEASTVPSVTSTPTQTTQPTVAPTVTASPSPVPNTGSALGTEVYIAIAAAAVIAIVAAAALVLRKRK
jgi:outer membrane protein assembly factor BamB